MQVWAREAGRLLCRVFCLLECIPGGATRSHGSALGAHQDSYIVSQSVRQSDRILGLYGGNQQTEELPPLCLPAKCKHLDILKNILINCSNLPFKVELVHIEAHQDDQTDFNLLSQPAQLNCMVDAGAKKCLWEADASGLVVRCRFLLEPVACHMGKDKMTSDTGGAM